MGYLTTYYKQYSKAPNCQELCDKDEKCKAYYQKGTDKQALCYLDKTQSFKPDQTGPVLMFKKKC